MKKVWAVQLDLIAEFARVCEKHNLKWWIDYGTLLGAVRHKGFIPWDDDVDILMMRSDFEKLCELADNNFQHPYHLRTPYNDYELPMEFAKLHNEDTTMLDGYDALFMMKQGRKFSYSQGIYIDIFPLYGVPDDDEEFLRIFKRLKSYKKKANLCYKLIYNYYPAYTKWKRPFKAMLHYLAKVFGIHSDYRKYFNEFMETLNMYDTPDSKRVAEFWPISQQDFLENLVLPRAYFDETVYLQFEMLSLPTSSCYEELLERSYGNWHEFKISAPHGKFYDADRSYKYYIEHELPYEIVV